MKVSGQCRGRQIGRRMPAPDVAPARIPLNQLGEP
jgi:hypothetical protein